MSWVGSEIGPRDVVLTMVTYNSADRLGRMFEDVLISSLNIPYRLLILVDDSTSDKTRTVVKKFADEHGKELIVERSWLYGGAKTPTRATARQTAIDIFRYNTSAGYVFFLDDDFDLSPGWWPEFLAKMGEFKAKSIKWGLAWGINWDVTKDRAIVCAKQGRDYTQCLIEAFYRRGGMHDTLIPRDVLEEAQDVYGPIPPWLHIYEDAWIWHSIHCLGYFPIIIFDSGVHLNSWRYDPKAEAQRIKFEVKLVHKYGISESNISYITDPLWLQMMGLVRPILGIPLAVWRHVKMYGLIEGVKRAFIEQYLKIMWRIENLIATAKFGRVPKTPCEGLARAAAERWKKEGRRR